MRHRLSERIPRGAWLILAAAALSARADVSRDDYGAGPLPRVRIDSGSADAAPGFEVPDRKGAQASGGAEPAQLGMVDLMISLHGEEGRRLMLTGNFQNLLGLVRRLPQEQRTLQAIADPGVLRSAYVMERTTPTERETFALVQKSLAALSPTDRAYAVHGLTEAARLLDGVYGPAPRGRGDPAVEKFVRIFDHDVEALFPAGRKAPRDQLSNLRLELVARVMKDFSREIIPDLLEQKLREAARGLGIPPDGLDRARIHRATEAILSGRTQGVINTDPRFAFASEGGGGPRGSFDECLGQAKNQAAMLNCLVRAKTALDEPAFEWAARNLPRRQLPAAPGLPTPPFSVGELAAQAADRTYGKLGDHVPTRSPSGQKLATETDRLGAFLEENLDQIIDQLLGQAERSALHGPGAAAARARLEQLRENLKSAGVREEFRRRLQAFVRDRHITQTQDLLTALAQPTDPSHAGSTPAFGERMILQTVADELHRPANQKLVAEIVLTPAVGPQGAAAVESAIDARANLPSTRRGQGDRGGAPAGGAGLTRSLAERLPAAMDALAPRPTENGENYLTRLNAGGGVSGSAAQLATPLLQEIAHQLDCVVDETGLAPASDPTCGTLDCEGILRDHAGHPLFSKEVSSLVQLLRPAATDRVQDPLYRRTCRQSVHAVLDALPGILAANDGQRFLDHPLAFFPKMVAAVRDAHPRVLDCVIAGSMDRVVLPALKPLLAQVHISDGDAYEAFGGQRIYATLATHPAMQRDTAQLTDALEAAVRSLAQENDAADAAVTGALRDFARRAVSRVLNEPHTYRALLTGVLTDPKLARLQGLQQDDDPDSSNFHIKNLLDTWIKTQIGDPLTRAQIAEVFARRPAQAEGLCREIMGPVSLFAATAVDSSLWSAAQHRSPGAASSPSPRPSGVPCNCTPPLPFQEEPPAAFRQRLTVTSREQRAEHATCSDPDRNIQGASAIYDTVSHWLQVDQQTREREQIELARRTIDAGQSRDPSNILAWFANFEKGFDRLQRGISDEDRRAAEARVRAEWEKNPATPKAARRPEPTDAERAAAEANQPQPAPAPAP